jgi:hypothetical protein
MKQYECFELALPGREPVGSQAAADLAATFHLRGKQTEVKGFYAGNGAYKVRFYPQSVGTYHYEIHGAAQASGEIPCVAADALHHGMVRAQGTHFVYEDGSKYIPFGTTVYALVHQKKSLVDRTMKTLRASPFNKVRLCVFPKHYEFNENEPEFFAFGKTDGKWDFDKPCFAFWDQLEARIVELGAMEVEADLILFHPYDRWGFSSISKADCFKYLEYSVRRLSAFPNVWWSLANEYDLMDRFGAEWWPEFAAFLGRKDPYKHLLSNHNCLKLWDFCNPDTTHCCIQSQRVDETPYWARKTCKPVIYDEMCYEGNIKHDWGNISAFEMINRFWKVCTLGGYGTHGETYMDPLDILWWSKGGTLKGESPKRIGFLKNLLYSLPGPLEFHREGLALDADSYDEMHTGKAFRGEAIDPFFRSMLDLSREDLIKYAADWRQYAGHIGDIVFLNYYARHCTCAAELNLPENGTYTVEVIDVWEMTRKTVSADARGKVEIALPGKEGMAVLAIRNDR